MNDVSLNALKVGEKIQRYVINDVLGAGGFGIVYSAQHLWLGYEVVIKEFFPLGMVTRVEHSVLANNAELKDVYLESLEKFTQECETLLRLKHPSVVYVYDCFSHNGTAYMVMHKQIGETLTSASDRLYEQQSRPFLWHELAGMLASVFNGLEYIHSKGIIHRDIKPDNIFLQDNQLTQPIILDFGAVKIKSNKIESQFAPSTPGYAPIEQEYSFGESGPWMDVYALGMTILRLLTGELPCRANDRPDAGSNLVDPTTEQLRKLSTSVSNEITSALYYATMKYADERTQSVTEFRRQLGI